MGDVELGEGVGVWFGAVLRGDNTTITVGAGTNIQEHTMIHVDPGFPATIGTTVTIGHRAIVHGCTVGDNSLIGMKAASRSEGRLLTKDPAPRRASVMPSDASRTSASRTMARDTPKVSASFASDGRRAPTSRSAYLMISTMPA